MFSHLACYNASFLRSDGSHYGDSLKKHGLDLELARETFDQLSRVENPALCELVLSAAFFVTRSSLPSSALGPLFSRDGFLLRLSLYLSLIFP